MKIYLVSVGYVEDLNNNKSIEKLGFKSRKNAVDYILGMWAMNDPNDENLFYNSSEYYRIEEIEMMN